MKLITHGTLPTASAIHSAAHAAGLSAVGVLALCKASLRQNGPNEHVRDLLRVLGFDWEPLEGCTCGALPCMCLDVEAVAEALTVADLAGELGAKSRELAEAIAALPKCITALDQQLQVKRITQLRAERDELAKQYRAASTQPEVTP